MVEVKKVVTDEQMNFAKDLQIPEFLKGNSMLNEEEVSRLSANIVEATYMAGEVAQKEKEDGFHIKQLGQVGKNYSEDEWRAIIASAPRKIMWEELDRRATIQEEFIANQSKNMQFLSELNVER